MRDIFKRARALYHLVQWYLGGKPLPPPHAIKVQAIRHYAHIYAARTCIETGTFHGDTIAAVLSIFDRIISIELDATLYARAQQRFKGYSSVTLLNGDSGILLPTVLASLQETALFWLDGHYSGEGTAHGSLETPILNEVRAILAHPHPQVILIDDARLFNGTHDYPTIAELSAIVGGQYTLFVADDIIRILPL
ncbi:MAG TPA: hypothetical protein VIY48_15510 [Candidatus Paceibacterota bacterium]